MDETSSNVVDQLIKMADPWLWGISIKSNVDELPCHKKTLFPRDYLGVIGSRYGNKRDCSINCGLIGGAWVNFIVAILCFLLWCIALLFTYVKDDFNYYDSMPTFLVTGILAFILAGLSVVGFNLRRAEGY